MCVLDPPPTHQSGVLYANPIKTLRLVSSLLIDALVALDFWRLPLVLREWVSRLVIQTLCP
jgi:hypothetical protein